MFPQSQKLSHKASPSFLSRTLGSGHSRSITLQSVTTSDFPGSDLWLAAVLIRAPLFSATQRQRDPKEA